MSWIVIIAVLVVAVFVIARWRKRRSDWNGADGSSGDTGWSPTDSDHRGNGGGNGGNGSGNGSGNGG